MRRAFGRLISSFGFEVQLYASGRECLDGAFIDRAVCVIVDVSMPHMNGFELQALLEASGRSIPTVFISAHTDLGYRERAASVGAIAYLDKPCDERLLLDAIGTALAKYDACRS